MSAGKRVRVASAARRSRAMAVIAGFVVLDLLGAFGVARSSAQNDGSEQRRSGTHTRVRAETLRVWPARVDTSGTAPDAGEEIDASGDAATPNAVTAPDSANASPAAPLPPRRPAKRRGDASAKSPAASAEEERELRQIREEIERMRERASDLEGREAGILRGLDDVEREIDLQDRLLRSLLKRRERVLGVLHESRAELDWANSELARRQQVFLERLRAAYKLGKYHEYEIMLGSRSFVDLVRRYDFILSLAERDRELHRGVVRQKQEVEARAEELRRTAAEISQIEGESEIERARLVDRREQRMRVLTEIRSERRSREEAIAELESSATQLQRLVTSFEEKREVEAAKGALPPPATVGLAGRAGTLAWPTDGNVAAKFGRHVHPEFGTATFNNGIDIEAEAGSPIHAVGGGAVEFVSTVPGYGNCIIVNHADGFYTVYAHASEILVRPGDAVTEGQVIARVGSTGSLSGDRLHFEIRDRKKPVDPLMWLRRR
ncbi:MAG: murein hydrolase activator EnvC family protein [bacterium]